MEEGIRAPRVHGGLGGEVLTVGGHLESDGLSAGAVGGVAREARPRRLVRRVHGRCDAAELTEVRGAVGETVGVDVDVGPTGWRAEGRRDAADDGEGVEGVARARCGELLAVERHTHCADP